MLAYSMMVPEKTHNFTAIYQVLLELCAAAIWQQQWQSEGDIIDLHQTDTRGKKSQ